MNPIAILAALRAHWRTAAGIGALIALAVLFALYKGERRHSAKLQTQLTASIDGRKQDRASYVSAQAAAAALNKAQVATIEAQQEKVSAEQKSSYQRDLARLRASGVRQDLAAPVRVASGAKAGSVPAPACVSSREDVCVARARVLQGAESELAKNALIDWVNAQAGVTR
jgi:hypothetical protein